MRRVRGGGGGFARQGYVGMHNCGFYDRSCLYALRTKWPKWRETWKRNLREASQINSNQWWVLCSDEEAESGECTVTVWTLDCGVSFVGCGRVVCFLFRSFTSCIYLFIQDSTPTSFFFMCFAAVLFRSSTVCLPFWKSHDPCR